MFEIQKKKVFRILNFYFKRKDISQRLKCCQHLALNSFKEEWSRSLKASGSCFGDHHLLDVDPKKHQIEFQRKSDIRHVDFVLFSVWETFRWWHRLFLNEKKTKTKTKSNVHINIRITEQAARIQSVVIYTFIDRYMRVKCKSIVYECSQFCLRPKFIAIRVSCLLAQHRLKSSQNRLQLIAENKRTIDVKYKLYKPNSCNQQNINIQFANYTFYMFSIKKSR